MGVNVIASCLQRRREVDPSDTKPCACNALVIDSKFLQLLFSPLKLIGCKRHLLDADVNM